MVLKVGFPSDAREETFLVSQKTFSEQFLKETSFECEKHFNNLKNFFSTIKSLLCHGKFP